MPTNREERREQLFNLRGMFETTISQLDGLIETEENEDLRQSIQMVRNKVGGASEWVNRCITENDHLQPKEEGVVNPNEPMPSAPAEPAEALPADQQVDKSSN